jgi:hypothetical protein
MFIAFNGTQSTLLFQALIEIWNADAGLQHNAGLKQRNLIMTMTHSLQTQSKNICTGVEERDQIHAWNKESKCFVDQVKA